LLFHAKIVPETISEGVKFNIFYYLYMCTSTMPVHVQALAAGPTEDAPMGLLHRQLAGDSHHQLDGDSHHQSSIVTRQLQYG